VSRRYTDDEVKLFTLPPAGGEDEVVVRPAWSRPRSEPEVEGWRPHAQPKRPAEPSPEPPRGGPRAGAPEARDPEGAPPEASADASGGAIGEGAARPGAGEGGPPPAAAAPPLPPGAMVMTEAQLAARDEALVAELRAPYEESARRLAAGVVELQQRLHEDMVELAARVGEVLMYREVRSDPAVILDITRRALRMVGPMERVVVKCAPEDEAILREHLDEVARHEAGRAVEVIVRASDDIDVGGCLLTFESGIVDARSNKRLERIIDALKAAVSDAPAAELHGAPPPRPRSGRRVRTSGPTDPPDSRDSPGPTEPAEPADPADALDPPAPEDGR